MKLVTIVGARPQFIKAAVLSRALKKYPQLKEVIVHTGQHYDYNMSASFFREMDIPEPDYSLGINSMSHAAMTGKMLIELEKVLLREKPRIVIVYGDTNSTLAGALAAAKLNIPVAHIEAGMRSFDMRMPEEVNRVVTDTLSQFFFVTGEVAFKNLQMEGLDKPENQILKVGDIMYDAFLYYKKKALKPKMYHLPDEFILLTLHRQENLENADELASFFQFVGTLHNEIPIVFPCHPGTRKKLDLYGITPGIELIEPVGYFEMLYLLNQCSLVMTDSGGLQKEAFYAERYCITLRNNTEWKELVDLKVNWLTSLNTERILEALSALLSKTFNCKVKPYGDGNTGELIAEALFSYLS